MSLPFRLHSAIVMTRNAKVAKCYMMKPVAYMGGERGCENDTSKERKATGLL